MTEMASTRINDKWPLVLPAFRVDQYSTWTTWEPERLESMSEHIGPGDVVFDIGSEVGDFPCLWSLWGADVVLIEPAEPVWGNIRATFEANGFMPKACYVGFASDHDRDSKVGLAAPGRWPGCASRDPIENHGFAHLAQEGDGIPQIKIDTLAAKTGIRPTALTIDCEGSELLVLQGAEQTLRNGRLKVWVSIHTDRQWMEEIYDGVGRPEVLAFMEACGYEGTHLATDHEEHWFFSPKESAHVS